MLAGTELRAAERAITLDQKRRIALNRVCSCAYTPLQVRVLGSIVRKELNHFMATDIVHWITPTREGGREIHPLLAFGMSSHDEERYPLLLLSTAVETLLTDFYHTDVAAVLQHADGQANEEGCPRDCRPPWTSNRFGTNEDELRLVYVAHVEPEGSYASLRLICEGARGGMQVSISAYAGERLEQALEAFLEYKGTSL